MGIVWSLVRGSYECLALLVYKYRVYRCSFKHLNRSFNSAAHELAQFARRNGIVNLWKGVTSPFLVPFVQSDLLRYSA